MRKSLLIYCGLEDIYPRLYQNGIRERFSSDFMHCVEQCAELKAFGFDDIELYYYNEPDDKTIAQSAQIKEAFEQFEISASHTIMPPSMDAKTRAELLKGLYKRLHGAGAVAVTQRGKKIQHAYDCYVGKYDLVPADYDCYYKDANVGENPLNGIHRALGAIRNRRENKYLN